MQKHRGIFFLFFIIYCTSLSAYQLSIAAIFQDEGPYLKEWIEYHRMVGVEHFWLYNDASTDECWEKALRPYIKAGIVELTNWPVPNVKRFPIYQVKAYKDALEKAKNRTKWLALIDLDEFLLPLHEKTVTECLEKHFQNASAVYINWLHFGTGGIFLQEGESLLTHLTTCSKLDHSRNAVGKSIVKPAEINIPECWYPHHFVLKPDGHYYYGDGTFLKTDKKDLKTDGKTHYKYIRINHYTMRDENYFYKIRLPRANRRGIKEDLVWQHYHAFNESKNRDIIDFIERKHPEKYKKFWSPLNLLPFSLSP